ncbi:MAG: hypothetical protein QOC87_2192, partial [Actinomycetota bacterium]|jgi:hypothetical protein|nr:hypothetical protein [Actinomycetota bacterium]
VCGAPGRNAARAVVSDFVARGEEAHEAEAIG